MLFNHVKFFNRTHNCVAYAFRMHDGFAVVEAPFQVLGESTATSLPSGYRFGSHSRSAYIQIWSVKKKSSFLLLKFQNEVSHRFSRFRIKVCCRLIQKQHLRLMNQRPCNRYFLFSTLAKSAYQVFSAFQMPSSLRRRSMFSCLFDAGTSYGFP